MQLKNVCFGAKTRWRRHNQQLVIWMQLKRFSLDRADKAQLHYTKLEDLCFRRVCESHEDTLQCIIHSCSTDTNLRLKIVLSQITVIDDSRSKKRCELVENLRETKKNMKKRIDFKSIMLDKLGGKKKWHTSVWTLQTLVSGQVGGWGYSTSARTEG